jgi:hemerythrin superfamily protein
MFSLKNVSPSVTDMIRFDHSHVFVTSHQYVSTKKPFVKKALAETICDALEIHATLEEEVFYPAMRQLGLGGSVLGKSVPEHNEMRRLIGEIRGSDPNTPRYDQLVYELMRDVLHHVADEETVLLPEAERMLGESRLNELGVQMTKRRLQLLAPKAGKAAANTVIGFSSSTAAVVVSVVSALLLGRFISKKLTT